MKKSVQVVVKSIVDVYRGFFTVKSVTFDQERYDGTIMENVKREVFTRDPVVILALYDKKHDKHLFVEQVRVGAIENNPDKPSVFEPVAGIIDQDETPIQAAIREAKEETGVLNSVQALKIVHEGYTSPGGSSEYAYFVTGNFDSSTYKEQIGGMEGEQEDIRSHLIDTETAMKMIENGEINSLTGAFGVYWHKVHS